MCQKISFQYNAPKIVEVILWLINRSPNKEINLYNLMRTIFHADIYHLNHYGRPVTGDTYVAMQYGTVPSFTYDLTGDQSLALAEFEEEIPFEKSKAHKLIAKRACNTDLLSESDIESLEEGFREYGELSFEDVKQKNHTHPAWRESYEKTPNGLIPFEMLITNKEVLKELSSINSLSIKT
jgi:hypothetical protein